ncbi:invasion protein expression up-regulator [Aerococcus viridans]|uniref:Invasion protein expression up-regulator n=1 Tax=Aerococcus viridans TaxID=1377 RepID=A0A2J9PL96_9LACT|nr:invasion protein expression up-regulator [Aerococcus viridans]
MNQWISIKVITAEGNFYMQKIKIGQTISVGLGPGFN